MGLDQTLLAALPPTIPLLSGVSIEVPVDYLRLPFCAFAIRLVVVKITGQAAHTILGDGLSKTAFHQRGQ